MSLDWRTKEDSPARETALNQPGLLQAAVFGLMFIGKGSITEENVPEITARLNLVESLSGPTLYGLDDDGSVIEGFRVEHVQAVVGLSVNVANEPEAKWAKRIVTNYLRDQERAARVKIQEQRKVEVDTLTPVGEHSFL